MSSPVPLQLTASHPLTQEKLATRNAILADMVAKDREIQMTNSSHKPNYSQLAKLYNNIYPGDKISHTQVSRFWLGKINPEAKGVGKPKLLTAAHFALLADKIKITKGSDNEKSAGEIQEIVQEMVIIQNNSPAAFGVPRKVTASTGGSHFLRQLTNYLGPEFDFRTKVADKKESAQRIALARERADATEEKKKVKMDAEADFTAKKAALWKEFEEIPFDVWEEIVKGRRLAGFRSGKMEDAEVKIKIAEEFRVHQLKKCFNLSEDEWKEVAKGKIYNQYVKGEVSFEQTREFIASKLS